MDLYYICVRQHCRWGDWEPKKTNSQTKIKIVVFGKETKKFCEEVTMVFGENLKLIPYFNKQVRGTTVTILQILRDIDTPTIQVQQEKRSTDQKWWVGLEKRYSAIILKQCLEEVGGWKNQNYLENNRWLEVRKLKWFRYYNPCVWKRKQNS